MSLWGNNDNAANSVIWAPAQVNKAPSAAERDALYANTTKDAYITNTIIGQFGLDTTEMNSTNAAAQHAGWILKRTGTGGVKTITLVSGGSGINTGGGFLAITGGGGAGANASYTTANSQNVLQVFSTNPAWNVINTVTLTNPGANFTSAAAIVYNGANTTRPVITLTMGDRVGRVTIETLVAGGSIV
jgi:hypothetical protein